MREGGETVPAPDEPALEYRRRREARALERDALARRERALSNLRLAVFIAGAILAWVVLSRDELSALWLLVLVGVFLASIVVHDSARRATLRAERAVVFYERGLARLEHRFAGTGRSGDEFAEPDHPYAVHLDLFGEGGLYELMSWAQTRAGEEILARWLLTAAEPAEIRIRHAAVSELRGGIDLREDLATLAPDVRSAIHPEALSTWGSAQSVLRGRSLRPAAAGLAALTVLAAGLWLWAGTGPLPLAFVLVVQSGFALRLRRRVDAVVEAVDPAVHDLKLLSGLLERIEREDFRSERLLALRSALDTDGAPASAQVRSLLRRVELLDSRRNQLFALFTPFVLWKTQCALAIEAWRSRCGPHLAGWISAVGELEAFCDLAAYAYEHPQDPFPELLDEGPHLEAHAIGHPLIPGDRCVRNDVTLSSGRNLLIVSGSNMSGKSTLLRTLGINVALAQAGAPVRARRLVLSPLAIGASLRVQDSLREGTSRFYAEITILRRVVALAEGATPLLFLLDEILNGTNSHDRRIGAAGILAGLVERGAIGLVTTHDLALAKIADDIGGQAANVHFADELRDGELSFDYHLQEGVVQRSNALQLMRSVGLRVGDPSETAGS